VNKKTVVFVDDEPKILKGLRRTLDPLRDDWEMLFAESGAQALEILGQTKVTALITDMRMPGMSGFELLQTVHQSFPSVIRAILTGQPDRKDFSQIMAVSHYLLWKPAKFEELNVLLNIIKDTCNSLHDENLLQLVGGINCLPSLPPLYNRLIHLIEDQMASSAIIAAIIEEDMSMTAQVLKLVNSAYFNVKRRVESIQDAISYLGMDILSQLVLAQNLFSQCSEQESRTFRLAELWQHSLCTASMAKAIASSMENKSAFMANRAYLAGLLHDIGKLVLIRHLPDTYIKILQHVQQSGKSQIEVEDELLGVDHAVIGGYLIALWGLPHNIVEATTLHHRTSMRVDLGKVSPVLEAVWHANRICHGDCTQSQKYQEIIERSDAATRQ